MITREREDYLKIIYELETESAPARTTQIAAAMGVEPASVTGLIKRLAELKLLNYEPYKGVTLTKAGEKVALEVIRHHRLLELYLIDALGYSWDEVDAEAEALEHVISEQFEDRIAALLGHPEHDPHGSPIPSKDGVVKPRRGKPLTEMEQGQEGIVRGVFSDDDAELLRYLAEIGLLPKTKVRVLEAEPFGGSLQVMIGDTNTATSLGQEAASMVYVEVKSDE